MRVFGETIGTGENGEMLGMLLLLVSVSLFLTLAIFLYRK
jgi:hypothetical protein